jgi:3-deoxy-D-manno-octulosonic-acid transferase
MRATLLDCLYLLLAILALPRLLTKRRAGWPARFGKGAKLQAKTRPRVLLVAVSLGEVNLLRSIVRELGDVEIVIASTTDTGFARARELFAEDHAVVRYPLDFSRSVRRFLARVQPDAVALVELELWPNFLAACRRRRIPVAVINGRMSDRSAPRYRRFAFITRRWFSRLAVVGAQDELSAKRFRDAGAADVRVTGNMKWDASAVVPDPADVDRVRRRLGLDASRLIVVAGSTAPGEPELLRQALPAGAQLVVAPRRPEWFDAAAGAFPVCSRWSAGDPEPGADVAILDAIGKLAAAYALADIVVLGRSFGDLHGSDPMEPAGLAKPLLIGPAHADFRSSVKALESEGGLRVVAAESLRPALAELAASPEKRAEMGAAARRAAERLRGASARNAAIIRGLIDAR